MTMNTNDLEWKLKSLAVLTDPIRRRLYEYVVGRGRDVSRAEAARAARVSPALAAFHLDKLVEADLLQATFRRLSGRSGPGAGRPSKLYRRSSSQFDVSFPQRRYELAAHVLLQALAGANSEGTLEALRIAAREWGGRLAKESAPGTMKGRPIRRAARALEACGFEPHETSGVEGEVVLRNCPFDSLRNESRDMICAMNLALIEGLLAGLGMDDVRAKLTPRPGMCCVTLRNCPETE
jgi:predicted ArsR family transcriptional regulator